MENNRNNKRADYGIRRMVRIISWVTPKLFVLKAKYEPLDDI